TRHAALLGRATGGTVHGHGRTTGRVATASTTSDLPRFARPTPGQPAHPEHAGGRRTDPATPLGTGQAATDHPAPGHGGTDRAARCERAALARGTVWCRHGTTPRQTRVTRRRPL